MADQLGSGMAAGIPGDGGALSPVTAAGPPAATHHGRPVSWVAVSTIMLGFLLGGAGLILGPAWWLFWVGVGLAAAGGLLALATDIFSDWY
jgi:ABC-type uncharacterized transport system permease subunit